ncbi:hypothetical protein DFJ77DRAFT_127511 [Powellomyces hirtus]|nr:hypothetical protein DFJ77DRAFT_127511 [Powellomyces hirtus]
MKTNYTSLFSDLLPCCFSRFDAIGLLVDHIERSSKRRILCNLSFNMLERRHTVLLTIYMVLLGFIFEASHVAAEAGVFSIPTSPTLQKTIHISSWALPSSCAGATTYKSDEVFLLDQCIFQGTSFQSFQPPDEALFAKYVFDGSTVRLYQCNTEACEPASCNAGTILYTDIGTNTCQTKGRVLQQEWSPTESGLAGPYVNSTTSFLSYFIYSASYPSPSSAPNATYQFVATFDPIYSQCTPISSDRFAYSVVDNSSTPSATTWRCTNSACATGSCTVAFTKQFTPKNSTDPTAVLPIGPASENSTDTVWSVFETEDLRLNLTSFWEVLLNSPTKTLPTATPTPTGNETNTMTPTPTDTGLPSSDASRVLKRLLYSYLVPVFTCLTTLLII